MQFWIIQGLNSLSLGGLLFLLSSGFSLIFGLMRLANLTHGAFFMLGTYIAATALRSSSSVISPIRNASERGAGSGTRVRRNGRRMLSPLPMTYFVYQPVKSCELAR